MSRRMFRNSLAVLFLVVLFGVLVVAGAEGTTTDMGQVTAVVNDGTAKAKEIAAALILLFSSLLAIALVVMLYQRTAKT